MPDASDEQTWWSNLFTGGADTGLEIPDGIWESVVAATFEIDTQPPADQLLPTNQVDNGFDELDDEPDGHRDLGHSSAHTSAASDDVGDGSFEEATHHDNIDHEVLYDADPDDADLDGDHAVDDEF